MNIGPACRMGPSCHTYLSPSFSLYKVILLDHTAANVRERLSQVNATFCPLILFHTPTWALPLKPTIGTSVPYIPTHPLLEIQLFGTKQTNRPLQLNHFKLHSTVQQLRLNPQISIVSPTPRTLCHQANLQRDDTTESYNSFLVLVFPRKRSASRKCVCTECVNLEFFQILFALLRPSIAVKTDARKRISFSTTSNTIITDFFIYSHMQIRDIDV